MREIPLHTTQISLLVLALMAPGCVWWIKHTDTGDETGSLHCLGGIEPKTWYDDADGDGYGDEATSFQSCDTPDDAVRTPDDCDDTRDDVYPGASETDCDDPVDYNCDGSAGHEDRDGDGAEACTDCDDSDAGRNPNETEVCDGVDQDCDGEVDDDAEDAEIWYTDSDDDGYGDADAPVLACTCPADAVVDDTDCDDTRADVSPEGSEVCDADRADEDCDGLRNSEDPDATGSVTWCADNDGDGYGGSSPCVDGCDGPDGYSGYGDDCDDHDPDRNPGADEYCNGKDDDCDGTIDEDAVDATTWYLDYDNDGYGATSPSYTDCTAPDQYVDDDTDCDDHNSGVNPDQEEICDDDLDDDCDGSGWGCITYVTRADASYTGEASGDYASAAVVPGDLDGDDYPDLVVGAYGNDDGGDWAGAVYIVSGPITGGATLGDVGVELEGAEAEEMASVLASAGDFTGSGDVSFVVGNQGRDWAAYVVTGLPSSSGAIGASADALALAPPSASATSTDSVGGGQDVDGDGAADVVLGMPEGTVGGEEMGAIYLYLGGTASGLADFDWSTTGAEPSDYLGKAVAMTGDLDGDGTADFAAAAPSADGGGGESGEVYVFSASSSSSVTQIATIVGENAYDYLGEEALTDVGDTDGDGISDLLIGAYRWKGGVGSEAGAAYIVAGPLTGTIALDATTYAARITSSSVRQQLGRTVAGVGDIQGDGYNDVLLGAPGRDDYTGAALLYLGPLTGEKTDEDADVLIKGSGSSMTGWRLAPSADVNRDATPDLIIGEYGSAASGQVDIFSGDRFTGY